jgi:hypothetical protein
MTMTVFEALNFSREALRPAALYKQPHSPQNKYNCKRPEKEI